MMKSKQILDALRAGAVLTIEGPFWHLDSVDPSACRPERFNVDDDSMLEEEWAWLVSIRLCSYEDTEIDELLLALAQAAKVPVRQP